MMAHILLRHRDIENIRKLDVYREHGGYEGLKKAVTEMTPAEVIDVVRASGLRGRGGAGFPTGIKWGFIPKNADEVYIVINTDESETGTFKDRELSEKNPHQVIEGALIAAYAVGAKKVYNYFRGEFMDAGYAMEEAVKECYANGLLGENILGTDFSCDFHCHFGGGAYICGEETALIKSLEGERGQPWSKPPFPAIEGLYSKPTVVNNTETLANVPPILVNGAEWYTSMGTQKSAGVKIVCMSGHVEKPGNYEVIMGTTYRELIDMAGGMRGGKAFKALLPSGGSGPVITADALDAPMTYEGLDEYGSVMGSASVIVMDETTDMVWAALKMIHFFKHESCGKCTPCREGTFWMEQVLERIYHGHGTQRDIEVLESVAKQIKGQTLCALGEFAINPVLSTIRHFMDEYKAKVNGAAVLETAVAAAD
ncbi:MAG: NADH-quinone oxidoreductase subunit NuoF [Ardenticatenaceae bacterium]|nr:NADH-quinone oxidoreductase subunit NuoF [Ardenticatenaceae bacterium]MCB9445169.1 NADH-quinone oxidoreductase subunit NuoF [Ardenticatenaceae bacterium]